VSAIVLLAMFLAVAWGLTASAALYDAIAGGPK
jgi:hypothetical protein